jgi:hypothetical protein
VRGCFFIDIIKRKTLKAGSQVSLEFNLAQHIRDEQLMRSFEIYFGCGSYSSYTRDAGYFRVRNFKDIMEKIVPFFTKHNIIGVKAQDFQDFCRVVELVKAKKHLTTSGLALILEIKVGMNKNRLNKAVSSSLSRPEGKKI